MGQTRHPGVVDQRVQAAQFGDRALDRASCLPLVGDVALQHQRGAALIPDAVGDRVQPACAPGRKRHRRALAGERGCSGRADAALGPGHQRDGAIQYWLDPEIAQRSSGSVAGRGQNVLAGLASRRSSRAWRRLGCAHQ